MPEKRDENAGTPATVEPRPGAHEPAPGPFARASETLGLAGFALYAAAAPHSIAVSWVGLSFAVLGWLARTAATRRAGLGRSPLDLPLWLFFAWTALSCLLSEEPRLSVPKLVNVSTLLMFYLTQALVTRRAAVVLAALMILSGSAGGPGGAGGLGRGRGVAAEGPGGDTAPRPSAPPRAGAA